MVCPKCAGAAVAGAALGTAATVALADRFPFLQKHSYILPATVGGIAFALSSVTMTYGGYNLFKYILGMSTSIDPNSSCHDNEKPYTLRKYTFLPAKHTSDSEIAPITKCTEGSTQNEIFTLTKPINHIFGKGGLDILVLGDGEDHLYFSMCSTKIINGYVSTIHNFDRQHDTIHLFCTKKQLSPNDVSVKYNSHENVTYIIIAGNFEETAIAVVGNYPNLLDNIDLNTKYADTVATGVCGEEPIEV
jgi:hypothetical protein